MSLSPSCVECLMPTELVVPSWEVVQTSGGRAQLGSRSLWVNLWWLFLVHSRDSQLPGDRDARQGLWTMTTSSETKSPRRPFLPCCLRARSSVMVTQMSLSAYVLAASSHVGSAIRCSRPPESGDVSRLGFVDWVSPPVSFSFSLFHPPPSLFVCVCVKWWTYVAIVLLPVL